MSRTIFGDRSRLILLSFLMLFVELALIRWTGSNVIYLSYFSNFVLLGSFLGIGLGFLRGDRRPDLWPFAPIALGGLIAVVRFFPVDINSAGGEFLYFGELRTSGPPRALVLAVIFLVVAAVMAFIAQGVARTFVKFPPLEAYKLDLIGSVLGIIGFSALAFLRAPPLAWGAIAVLVMLALEAPKWSITGVLQVLGGAAIIIVLALETFSAGTSWSPYYKIEATPSTKEAGALLVNVNGLPHQAYIRALDANGETTNPLYNLTYDSIKNQKLDNVLVIGAGGGNDVSVALKRGAKHVDAVEIDPRLYDLGKSRHPDHPYSDPRVTAHIGDGRAFLEGTDTRYDLIIFALPDSLTLVSGNSALRLESYLFTKEAFEAAHDHLKPNGVFSLYNYYREGWLIDRYAGTARDTFGHDPCVIGLGPTVDLAVLVIGRERADATCGPNGKWVPTGAIASPATDDYPFAYLRTRSIPTIYSYSMALILAASIGLILLALYPWQRGVKREVGAMFRFTDLFFMGAAFLLLETKSVVQFALLFGTTWFVNALVFLGVLLSVLLAVAVSKRVTFKHPARLYLLLLASLALAWLIPPGDLLTLALIPRFVAASTLAFLPIFLANLIFTQRFKSVASSTTAFGANLLGAMVGGILEYMALITGYRALLLLVAVLYGLALLFGRRHLTDESPEGEDGDAELVPSAAEPAPASS